MDISFLSDRLMGISAKLERNNDKLGTMILEQKNSNQLNKLNILMQSAQLGLISKEEVAKSEIFKEFMRENIGRSR